MESSVPPFWVGVALGSSGPSLPPCAVHREAIGAASKPIRDSLEPVCRYSSKVELGTALGFTPTGCAPSAEEETDGPASLAYPSAWSSLFTRGDPTRFGILSGFFSKPEVQSHLSIGSVVSVSHHWVGGLVKFCFQRSARGSSFNLVSVGN